jgi:DNA-binding XRE family transcriptional regulator
VPLGKGSDDDHFGIIIKQGREKLQLTQEKFAELIEVDLRTIQRWEVEKCIPWPSCLEKVIGVLPEIGATLREVIKKKPGHVDNFR